MNSLSILNTTFCRKGYDLLFALWHFVSVVVFWNRNGHFKAQFFVCK